MLPYEIQRLVMNMVPSSIVCLTTIDFLVFTMTRGWNLSPWLLLSLEEEEAPRKGSSKRRWVFEKRAFSLQTA